MNGESVSTKSTKNKPVIVKRYVSSVQELEEARDQQKAMGNSTFKCMLSCGCTKGTGQFYRVGYKIYFPGNDSSFADEVILLCTECALL